MLSLPDLAGLDVVVDCVEKFASFVVFFFPLGVGVLQSFKPAPVSHFSVRYGACLSVSSQLRLARTARGCSYKEAG